jgi:peptidoglycan/LPS O-acetylase OafA/YrhL
MKLAATAESQNDATIGARVRSFFWGRSLEECIESGRDNILLVRLVAALLVIYGHSGIGGGDMGPYDFVRWISPDLLTHLVGLFAFFLLSGILVPLSYIRTPHLSRFLRARVLRIWPALAVCILLWAFMFGPMLSELSAKIYFGIHGPGGSYWYAYHGLSIFAIENTLPEVFVHNPQARQINTPLWSIAVEAGLYLWVAGAGVLRLLRLPWLTSIAIAAIFSYLVLLPMEHGQFALLPQLHTAVRAFFGAGAILCLLRKYVRISSGIMLVIAIVCGIMQRTIHHLPFALLATGYAVLWFSYVPRLPEIPRRADFSYGTYLWGWPVQQTVVMLGHVKAPLVVFAISAPMALSIGVLSWFLVEKPALRWKDRRIAWPSWMIRLVAKRSTKPAAPPEGATGVIAAEQPG